MLQSFMQSLWAFLGACSGLVFGVTKEGIDFFFSLRSVQGWKEIYTGNASSKSKKVDHGTSTRFPAKKPEPSGDAHQRQLAFLHVLLPEETAFVRVSQPTPIGVHCRAGRSEAVLGNKASSDQNCSTVADIILKLPNIGWSTCSTSACTGPSDIRALSCPTLWFLLYSSLEAPSAYCVI